MGYMSHHAIVVTGSDGNALQKAHAEAQSLGLIVTGLSSLGVNGFRSFLVAPDGSKEGWPESDQGNVSRAALKAWLRDEAPSVAWVEVQFGNDDYFSKIVDDSDA